MSRIGDRGGQLEFVFERIISACNCTMLIVFDVRIAPGAACGLVRAVDRGNRGYFNVGDPIVARPEAPRYL